MNTKQKESLDRARYIKQDAWWDTFTYIFPEVAYLILPLTGVCLILIAMFLWSLQCTSI